MGVLFASNTGCGRREEGHALPKKYAATISQMVSLAPNATKASSNFRVDVSRMNACAMSATAPIGKGSMMRPACHWTPHQLHNRTPVHPHEQYR